MMLLIWKLKYFLVVLFSGHKAQMNPSIGHALNTHKSTLHFERFLHTRAKINVLQFTFFNIYTINKNDHKGSKKREIEIKHIQIMFHYYHADMVCSPKLFNLVNLKKGTCLSIISHKSTPLYCPMENHMLNYETWKIYDFLLQLSTTKDLQLIFTSFSRQQLSTHFYAQNGQIVISSSTLLCKASSIFNTTLHIAYSFIAHVYFMLQIFFSIWSRKPGARVRSTLC